MPLPNDAMNFVYGLLNTVDEVARIKDAITTGAQWEVWMQTELALLSRQAGHSAVREVPYGDGRSLDILVQYDASHHIAIELKCESATNAGQPPMSAITDDWTKVQDYPLTADPNVTVLRLVVFLYYTSAKAAQVAALQAAHAAAVWTSDLGGVSVAMIDADQPAP